VEQQIRFCTSADGTRIAYATAGQGPPLVKAANWLNHLEFDWQSPIWGHLLRGLAEDHQLVRYDERGTGLSDRDVEDMSFESWVGDLGAVVDAAGLDRFALLGISQGGPVAIAYAVQNPGRVSHLILYGTYARWPQRRDPDQQRAFTDALLVFMRQGWGRDNPAFRQIFTSYFIPDATAEQMRSLNDLERESASPETAARIFSQFSGLDVTDVVPKIEAPTLILHRRGDVACPFWAGRRLASLVPGARFVPLEGRNHLILEDEPAGDVFLTEIRQFLGVKAADSPLGEGATHARKATQESAPTGESGGAVDVQSQEAWSSISELDVVVLSRFNVIGNYIRYDETVRNILKDARQKIVSGLNRPGRKRENHLIWAASGTGKTYFVEQVGASLAGSIHYLELNLAKHSESEFLAALGELASRGQPCLCLVDEIDAKPDETWPYEVLLPYLDASPERGSPFVFVLAGSGGESVVELKQRLAGRPKGKDLLSRIPSENEYEIAPLGILDRVLVVLSQFGQAAREAGREIRAVEKLALYYVAVNPRLSNARQLREFAVRAVDRAGPDEDRIKYDHLFGAGDPDNKEFWMQAGAVAGDFQNRFVIVED
jgi:pimeloyl-ACP methyl ester carboxylesterase